MTTARSAEQQRGRASHGSDRPGRIARAAIAVIGEEGVDALTHRKVAAMAGVPLGATTYYFASLDDLATVAIEEAARCSVRNLQEWARNLAADADLAVALADLVIASINEQRESTIAEYQLYAAALNRPGLRRAAAEWDEALTELFIARTEPLTGRMIATLICGLLMQAVLDDEAPSRDELVPLCRRALDGR
ncbi:TetR family transcriptional regulator [Saccharopolyspora halophila]|uniref:TetR family transcriptional regulator n=1 Tax=Saccharopolyspora halophila TaxID=405551 RepID=A0ABN3GQ66_9PSEU